MILRDELNRYLTGLYQVGDFQDYCENGLQVEGKKEINKIIFGVSFNQLFLEQAVKEKADAVIVHHGIFQQGVFKLKGALKKKVNMLLNNDISLFGVHLPMDGHPEIGHNSLLLKSIGAENIEPFDLGFQGENTQGHTLDNILDIYHKQLHPHDYITPQGESTPLFAMETKHGFKVLRNGPDIPVRVGIITGGSAGYFDKAIAEGLDTFFGGDIKEQTPGISLETKTNYVNLGHYFSEKPGVLKLQKIISGKFDVETNYIEISNPI
ncbi:MAG: Nif3-like dinuclear metal center hexameric protein [bacterium]|nr:Nif3-like dinuclear metal center hexameric protein [bacterium]